MRKLNLLLLSSALLLGIPAVTTLSSCDAQNNANSYKSIEATLVKGDSLNLNELAVKNDIDLSDSSKGYVIKYESSNLKVAKVTNEGNVLGKSEGSTIVSIVDLNSDSILLKVAITVTGYEEYSDVKTYQGKGSFGGYFIDLNVGCEIAKGKSYGLSYSNDAISDQSLQAVVSNPEIVSWIDNDGTYSIEGLSVGNSKLELYNSNNELVYRTVVKVRRGFESSSEVLDYLQTTDYFSASGYGEGRYDGDETKTTKLSFNSEGLGILYGYNTEYGGDIGQNTFNLEFQEFYTTYNTWRFSVINFTSAVDLGYVVKYLDVTETGDELRLYSSIILDMYYPRNNI